MVVQIEHRQRADVDLELQPAVDALGQLLVQAVDALDDDGLARLHPEGMGLFPPHAGVEVVLRQLHRLAVHQPLQVVGDQRGIQRVDALQVDGAVRLPGQLVPVAVVVVQRDLHRPQALHPQCNAQAVGESGLSRG